MCKADWGLRVELLDTTDRDHLADGDDYLLWWLFETMTSQWFQIVQSITYSIGLSLVHYFSPYNTRISFS